MQQLGVTTGSPQVRINNKYFYVGDLFDKDLFAVKEVIIQRNPEGPVLSTVQKGSRIGKVYSYIIKNGYLWWQLYESNYTACVKHEPGIISLDALGAQGVLDTVTKIEQQQEADKTIFQNVWEQIKPIVDVATVVIPLGVSILLGIKLYGEFQKTKSYSKKEKP